MATKPPTRYCMSKVQKSSPRALSVLVAHKARGFEKMKCCRKLSQKDLQILLTSFNCRISSKPNGGRGALPCALTLRLFLNMDCHDFLQFDQPHHISMVMAQPWRLQQKKEEQKVSIKTF